MACYPWFDSGIRCGGYISCNGKYSLCVDSSRVCSSKYFNLFHRVELHPPGGIPHSNQYAENSNSSYCDTSAGIFQPERQWTAAKNHWWQRRTYRRIPGSSTAGFDWCGCYAGCCYCVDFSFWLAVRNLLPDPYGDQCHLSETDDGWRQCTVYG